MINSMTRDEFQEVLGEALKGLRSEIEVQIAALKSEGEIEPASEPAVKAEDVEGLGEKLDGIGEAIIELTGAVEGTQDALSKTLDRIEALEKRSVTKRSLSSQEGEEGDKSEPTLKDAIGAALRGGKVELS